MKVFLSFYSKLFYSLYAKTEIYPLTNAECLTKAAELFTFPRPKLKIKQAV